MGTDNTYHAHDARRPGGRHAIGGSALAKLLVADDDELFCEAVSRILGSRHDCLVVHDAPSALEQLRDHEFDLVLIDLVMPGNMNLEMVRAMGELPRSVPFIVVTGHATVEKTIQVFRMHARDLIRKPFDPTELCESIDQVLEQEKLGKPTEEWPDNLTDREVEITELLLRGSSPATIASTLFISVHTVRNHVKAIYRKLGVSSQVELITRYPRLVQ